MRESGLRKWIDCGVLTLVLVLALLGALKYISGYSTVSNNVNGKELPICSVETEEKKVSLTFDAAWGNKDMDKILGILREHKIHATFFLTGAWVEKYPEEVKQIKEAGHDLANGSESHRSMVEMTPEGQRTEVLRVHERVKDLTGTGMQFFRLPYGNYDDSVIRMIEECGYYPVQWSVNSLDWKDYGIDNIVETVLNDENMKNGAIVLLHNETRYTADALDKLISGIEQRGYRIVPVSELIYREDYHLDVTGRQIQDK